MDADHAYMAVTADRYELPIAIADTVPQLAKMLGISSNAAHQRISRLKGHYEERPGYVTGYNIVRVDLRSDSDGADKNP